MHSYWTLRASSATVSEQHDHDKAHKASFHFSKKFVGKTYFRDATEVEAVATDEVLEELTSTDNEWLAVHNSKRKEYQEGLVCRTVLWRSDGLEELVKEWAKENAQVCQNRSPGGKVEYGMNSQSGLGRQIPEAEWSINK